MRTTFHAALFIFFLGHGTVHASSESKTFHFQSNSGKVSFLAVGRPSAIKIRGEGTAAKGDLKTAKDNTLVGTLDFDLTSLSTGISMRDEHMKEKYLETKSYPTAQLKLTNFKLPDPKTKLFESKDLPFTGILTLKGIAHPVTGKISLTQASADSKTVNVDADFALKLSDYKIEIPTYAGITVAEEVKISLQSAVEIVGSR